MLTSVLQWGKGEGRRGLVCVLYITCICESQRCLYDEILWSSWSLVQQNIDLQHSWCYCLSWFASLVAMCSILLWCPARIITPLPGESFLFLCSSCGYFVFLILPSPICFWSSSSYHPSFIKHLQDLHFLWGTTCRKVGFSIEGSTVSSACTHM